MGDDRHHTFLFTDLVGFTALTADRGDDGAADVALDFYRRVRGLLTDHGAEEVKTLGDGLMLRAGEPALAIRLGLRIVAVLEEVPGFPPVRVGMHTGPAVARDADWYGSTVNIAARLCTAAGGGQVLVSEATHSAAGRLPKIQADEHRLHWLKNVSDPVPACVVTERPCPFDRMRRLRSIVGGGPRNPTAYAAT